MKWEVVEKNIKKECKARHKDSVYIQKYIAYSKNLFDNDLPIISSPEHFSLLIGMEHQYVCNMAYAADRFYRHFTIPKSNGKKREIDEPLPDLKFVQSWILENILEKCPISEYAKAYYKGRTLKHNARFHRAQSIVLTMDIKEFFSSISVRDVTKIFEDMGYFHELSCFLAYLCCLNNVLPQGAPTSPYLSNLRMRILDNKISQYTSQRKIRYTRYADDLTFSGDFNPHHVIKDISKLVYDEGFVINPDKTRVARRNARQEVTGIVVNSHMQISKEKRKQIRQQVYYIKKFGVESHLERINESRANYLNHLLGQINFALFVNPKDEEMKEYFNVIKTLLVDQN
ncbi:MAG: RNA-directed DNA polymerase [Ruminococcaceae bacterium]|nr:RNA-directed DNA polymerase [Oscillospiraceae bacterium]